MSDIMTPRTVEEMAAIISKIVLKGDLASLSDVELTDYYNKMCAALTLDPTTRPFELLILNGKKQLYATKNCTEQLRKKWGISCRPIKTGIVGNVYIVEVEVFDSNNRQDFATGAVNITNLAGNDLANAIMKAETKAKRRATLSICGLGMIDETEIETVRTARILTPVNANALNPTAITATQLSDELIVKIALLGRAGKLTIDERLKLKEDISRIIVEEIDPIPALMAIKEKLVSAETGNG